jgi:opacity protein-like surface antigen
MLKPVVQGISLLLLAALTLAPRAKAQAAIYGEFSGTAFTNLAGTNYAFGGTTGVLADVGTLFHRVTVTGDVQGRFLHDSSENFDSVTIGPRLEVPLKRGLVPYGEFMIGFARYNNNGLGISTTDSTIQLNGGVAKHLSPHWDGVLEYSYSQFEGLGGQFNPKSVSIGAIYHFTKR